MVNLYHYLFTFISYLECLIFIASNVGIKFNQDAWYSDFKNHSILNKFKIN